MKYILFTHNDMDGAGCEISFRIHLRHHRDKLAIHSSIEDLPAKVSRELEDPAHSPDKVEIFFSDITPPPEQLAELVNRGYRIRRFDHHPTAARNEGLVADQFDESGVECGTSLIDRYLADWEVTRDHHPASPRYDEFVGTIRAWDTWAWAKTNDLRAKYLTNLFWLLGIDRFIDLYVERWSKAKAKDDRPVILPEHMMFVEAKLENSAKVIDDTTPAKVITCRFNGYQVAVTFAGNGFSVSDGSYAFLSRYPDYDLMMNVNLGTRKVSIRTIRNDIDVGQLCTAYGGGGHQKAAGFPIRYETMTALIEACLGK